MRQANIFKCLQGMRGYRLLPVFALLPALLALSSCKGGSSASTTTPTPSVTVFGDAPSVSVNGKVQFHATPNNLPGTLVNWEAGGVAGGNPTFGTIDANGLYTAPATVPSNNIVTITAVSQSQSSVTGTANITILKPTTINSIVCVDPNTQQASLTVASGNSLACTAEATGGSPIAVFWQVNGTVGGNPTIGNMTQQGNYVAPLIPPAGGTVNIKAVSQADAAQNMTVAVTDTFGDRVLQGPYAFSTSGRVVSTNAFFARVGSFVAGGDGSIAAGIEDSNQSGPPNTVKLQRIFTGSYSIGADGRGTMQFCEDISTACKSPTAFFQIVLISPRQAQIIEFSSPPTTSALTTSGEIISQDQSVFGAGNGGLVGTYSFTFAGISATSADESAIGEFSSDGHGTISKDSNITPGAIDIDGGGHQTFSSSAAYSISSNGRGGPVSIGSLQFAFYMISAGRAKFIEIDSSPASILAGDAFRQQTTATCAWGLNSLNGSVVLETSGTHSGIEVADLGGFTATNDGTNGTVAAGFIDENFGGTVTPQIGTLTGIYTVNPLSDPDPCGRGTLTIGGHSYVFYLISASSAVLQEITSGVVAHGFLVQPQGGPFAAASFEGSYALSLTGTNAAGAAGKEEDVVGQLTSDGVSKVTAGSLDVNSFGTTQTVTPNIGTFTPVDTSGVANGRGTMLLNPTRNFVLYFVSPTQIFVLGTDAGGTAVGSLYKQF